MSCVLCMANANRAFIIGNGRAINIDIGEIISENYKKVIQVREDIIAGFAGTANVSEKAFDDLPLHIEKLSFNELATILCNGAKRRHEETGLSGSMILAGIENNAITIYEFNNNNDYKLERTEVIGDNIFLRGFYPNEIDNDVFNDLFDAYYGGSK